MTERREDSIAPPRPLTGPVSGEAAHDDGAGTRGWFRRTAKDGAPEEHVHAAETTSSSRTVRKARLRLVQIEPWSVMKASFLLSVAIGIVTVVAVAIVWGVLGAAGLWDSVNSIVRDSIGDKSGSPFQIQEYLGTSRVLGFTMLVAVLDVILITAIATLGAFLYNLAATLLGGIEVTFAEDR
jgi:hypothetical protein